MIVKLRVELGGSVIEKIHIDANAFEEFTTTQLHDHYDDVLYDFIDQSVVASWEIVKKEAY